VTHHHRQQFRSWLWIALLGGLLLFVLWTLVGCSGGFRIPIISDLLSPSGAKEAAKAPADPTQAQIAWTVAAPLGATAALLLVSGAVMFLLGAGLRAFQSILFGVILIIVNGIVITVLKSRWTMFVLLGTAVLTGVLLYFDSRDGIWFWKQLQRKKNGEQETPSWTPPPPGST
jgi:hypothetical protein